MSLVRLNIALAGLIVTIGLVPQGLAYAQTPNGPAAAQDDAKSTPRSPAQATDFVLPPPHGTPRELATGATRGIKPDAPPAPGQTAPTPAARP